MTARILDGRRVADALLDELKVRVDARLAAGRSRPGLAVVLVGADPASAVYVRNKRKAAEKVGIEAFDYDLPAGTSEARVLALIDQLNADPKIHGILVQLPLPGIADASGLIGRIDPRKDVDGFHPQNVGHLALRQFGLRPASRSCSRADTASRWRVSASTSASRRLTRRCSSVLPQPVRRTAAAEVDPPGRRRPARRQHQPGHGRRWRALRRPPACRCIATARCCACPASSTAPLPGLPPQSTSTISSPPGR